jgi:hypothetical protein
MNSFEFGKTELGMVSAPYMDSSIQKNTEISTLRAGFEPMISVFEWFITIGLQVSGPLESVPFIIIIIIIITQVYFGVKFCPSVLEIVGLRVPVRFV